MKVPYVNLMQQASQELPELQTAIGKVLARGNFILGEEVQAFEKEFANFCGVKHAIGVGNGTDSLILCLRLHGIGPGDEVITAPNSWISSASAIVLVGAKPVFVDVGSDQLIDVRKIEAAITKKTKAIIPVHLTGRMADMDAVHAIAEEYKLAVIEDAAQAVGSRRGIFQPGTQGNLCSFSLHPLKNLNALGDAGIITTEDDDLAAELRLLRNHGLQTRDIVSKWGYNSRLDEVQAAILRHRLIRLVPTIFRRRELAARYAAGLEFVKQVSLPITRISDHHTYHVFVIQCEQRDHLQRFLEENGIETKIHYPIPIHLQPAASGLGYGAGSFPNAESQANRILSLPINQYLSDSQIDYVAAKIREFYEKS